MARKKKEEKPEVAEPTKSLSKQWLSNIKRAKKKFEKSFERMRKDMEFARQIQKDENDNEYKANYVLRHINNKVSGLYAKNPKIIAQRRQKMLFKVWDGDITAIAEAKEATAALSQNPMMLQDPAAQNGMMQAQAVLQDYQEGSQKAKMMEKVGKTLEFLLSYFLDECQPRFKVAAKQAVRRCITTGIAWLKVGFQREMGKSPDTEAQIADCSRQLQRLQVLIQQSQGEDFNEDSAKAAELEAMMQALIAQPEIVVREGLVFTWPRSNKVILDPETTCIQGFVGTNWMAEEFLFTKDDIKQIFDVELEDGSFTGYGEDGKEITRGEFNDIKKEDGDTQETYALVYEVWDKRSGLTFAVCDGYDGFLKEPAAPENRIEPFFPYFPLMFNAVEDDKDIYPPSDVRLLMPMQLEYNRARHGMREHRIAARPGWATARGKLTQEDKSTLSSRPANAIVELDAIAPGDTVEASLQPLKYSPIDPNLYDTSYVFDDTQRVVGVAEANIGGTSNSTATESSIAESSRQTGMTSNINDVDEWLSDFSRAAGQILLQNMSAEKVLEIVGEGGVWPELTTADIMKDVWLNVEAGSSGLPNKALEVSNWERMLPFLLQIPGTNPKMVLKETLYRSDDRLTVEDFYMEGQPSIASMNNQTPMGQEGAMNGPQGAQNAPQPAGRGGQANMSAPGQNQLQPQGG